MSRRIIQIACDKFGRIYALCDDGTVWMETFTDGPFTDGRPWKQKPAIPQQGERAES